jgi:hypothetical protein
MIFAITSLASISYGIYSTYNILPIYDLIFC